MFAIQYRQAAANVVSYASFHATIDCLLRRYVLPYRARGRPNVVVFDEDTGLATLALGSRGALARGAVRPAPRARLRAGGQPCGALGALALLERRLRRAARRLPPAHVGASARSTGCASPRPTRSSAAFWPRSPPRPGATASTWSPRPTCRRFASRRDPSDLRPVRRPRPESAPQLGVRRHRAAGLQRGLHLGPARRPRSGPDVLRNVVATNLKVPLTSLETALGFTPGPVARPGGGRQPAPVPAAGHQRAARHRHQPAGVPVRHSRSRASTRAATPRAYYMRCLDRLGANLVIQDEANPGRWTGPDGNGIEQWQPLSWMASTYRTVTDPSVHFAYNVTAMMVGNLADLVFDGQSAITQRGGLRGPGCHYIGNGAFVPGEDQRRFRAYAGAQRGLPRAGAVGRPATARARRCARSGTELAAGLRQPARGRLPGDGARRRPAPAGRSPPRGAASAESRRVSDEAQFLGLGLVGRLLARRAPPPGLERRPAHRVARRAGASPLRAPQPASSRSAPASSWPALAELVDEPRRALASTAARPPGRCARAARSRG